MRAAFKEWVVIVDALGLGAQTLILRKGGISEGGGAFKMDHKRFLLFPTLFHQQRDSVVASAQARYDLIEPHFPLPDRLRLQYFAEVVEVRQIFSPQAATALHGRHVWRDEVIAERFDWGKEKAIFTLAVRVFRLPEIVDIPMSAAYGGCKSWIELDQDIATEGGKPVLTDAAFEEKLKDLRAVWQSLAPPRIAEAKL